MLWVSLALVVVLGGATVWFHSEAFIKWKPTLLYWAMGGSLLLGQLLWRKNLLKAVMGTQLAPTIESCRYDGVIGIWYGKAPGLHRASDALRHAVFAGTWGKGGAVALVGDDPNAKSSTLPSSSGATLVDLNMPLIFPGDVQEAIDLGRHAIAMSRAAGLWTSIKVVDTVADGSGTVELHPNRITPLVPTMEVGGRIWVPKPSGGFACVQL